MNRIRSGGSVDHYETIRRHKDGSLVDISLSVSPIRDEEGNIVGISKIARDITARKRIEEELAKLLEREQQARREADTANRLKDEFLATLSHELRNPLNVILGYAEVLLRSEEAKRSQFVKRAGEVLKRNALAQSKLIRDLLDLSRLHMGKFSFNPEVVSLTSVISNAVETVKAEAVAKEMDLKVETPEEVLFIEADPLRIEQVIWNLLNNAIKFTPRGGTVTVRLTSVDHHAVLSVNDTGQGIDQEFLPHVFEMFRQEDGSINRQHGGLGIGLALVEELIQLHNGSVTVTSPGLGQGAEFTIELPLTRETKEPLTLEKQVEAGMLSQMRILIVDDNVDTIEMLQRLFEMDGAVVHTARTGGEALEIVAKEEFDVVLSDISMPEMSGFELLRRLRALPKVGDVPVVAVTGFGRPEDVSRAKTEGFFSHVTKPIDVAELIETLQDVVMRNKAVADAATCRQGQSLPSV